MNCYVQSREQITDTWIISFMGLGQNREPHSPFRVKGRYKFGFFKAKIRQQLLLHQRPFLT